MHHIAATLIAVGVTGFGLGIGFSQRFLQWERKERAKAKAIEQKLRAKL